MLRINWVPSRRAVNFVWLLVAALVVGLVAFLLWFVAVAAHGCQR